MKRTHIVDKSTDHDKPHVHFDLLFTRYERQRKMFFSSEREFKKALRDTLIRAAWYELLSTMANCDKI